MKTHGIPVIFEKICVNFGVLFFFASQWRVSVSR